MGEEKEVKKERSSDSEKPASNSAIVDCVFPPFPDPDLLIDFDDDISAEEQEYYITKFPDIRTVVTHRLHCSACDRHLGSAHYNEIRIKAHPLLRTLICNTCHSFYNSGEFDKGDDGSELYCRWCGQGGQVYCCSNCPHVFCAKCIKRNFGIGKIKEIENTDDWKCFKCNTKCLWDLRAICWALLRYCDLKNKITQKTLDPRLKEEYLKNCAIDFTECCKNKRRSVKKKEEVKKESENNSKKVTASPPSALAKIPPTIQVKKFASVLPDEKKAKKRPLDQATVIRSPIPIAPVSNIFNNIPTPTTIKRVRVPNPNMNNIPPMRIVERSSIRQYQPPQRFSPRQPFMPMPMLTFNGLANSYNSMIHNDRINLSLDSLTQGLDMASVNTVNNNGNDDLVCTPDLPPLEPFCEVTEDNTDDDVQCITPVLPTSSSKISANVRSPHNNLSSDNIIQMTENDVTINKVTGGLKFRVDPQTLSSNKMYRLPDGRVFAITANPNMPAGYSATIVAVSESKVGNNINKVATNNRKGTTPKVANKIPIRNRSSNKSKPLNIKSNVIKKKENPSHRICDLDVPIEWFRYNLVDSIDALEYSQTRLNKLKKEANTVFLRTRTVEEMKKLHRRMENILNTSITRFTEIKKHLSEELKDFLSKKTVNFTSDDEIDDDDDDVEILPNNDDPIFIDENSVDSVTNETPDLTPNTNILEDCLSKDRNENEADQENNEIDESILNVSATIINSSKSSDEMEKNINDEEKEKSSEETQAENNINNEESEKCENNGDEIINDAKVDRSDKTIETDKNNIDQKESTNSTEKEGDNEKDTAIEKHLETEKEINEPMEIDETNNAAEKQQTEKEQLMSDDLIADLLKDDTCDATVTSFDNSVDFGDLE